MKDLPVLVVEDDASSAKLFCAVLQSEGCRARVVPTAEDALQLLRVFRPRIAVIDLILPRMGGLVLAQRIRTDPATWGVPLIAVTALHGEEVRRLALSAGFVECLHKPIDPLGFPQLLADHLGGHT